MSPSSYVGGVGRVESAILKRNTAGLGRGGFLRVFRHCEECLKADWNGDRMVEPRNVEIRAGCGQARLMKLAASSPLVGSDILEVTP